MEEPRPIAEQRTGGGSTAGCALVLAALLGLMVVAGGAYFVLLRRTETGNVAMPPVPPVPPVAPPSGPPVAPSGPPVVPMPATPPPLPPPEPEPPSAPTVSDGTEVRGSLDREVIRSTIRRHVSEVRYCYEEALARDPTLAGRVTVSFVIGPTGAVQSASSSRSTLSGPRATEVAECIVRRVRTWTFPAPDGGGIVAVDYPFVFTSSP